MNLLSGLNKRHIIKPHFMHGDSLFIRENGGFKILAIQLAYEAWTK